MSKVLPLVLVGAGALLLLSKKKSKKSSGAADDSLSNLDEIPSGGSSTKSKSSSGSSSSSTQSKEYLKKLGYDTSNLSSAIKKFQENYNTVIKWFNKHGGKKENLNADGKAGPKTLDALKFADSANKAGKIIAPDKNELWGNWLVILGKAFIFGTGGESSSSSSSSSSSGLPDCKFDELIPGRHYEDERGTVFTVDNEQNRTTVQLTDAGKAILIASGLGPIKCKGSVR